VNDLGAILIVDDSAETLRFLTQILSQQGYQVRPADSGELALASANFAPPDLILLDVRMPDIDGFEVCRRLKESELTRSVPVIFITALVEAEDQVRGFQLGAVDFIVKPFRKEELLARVRTHVELGRLRAHL
jgi:DNA-binding response OmpR family regulator